MPPCRHYAAMPPLCRQCRHNAATMPPAMPPCRQVPPCRHYAATVPPVPPLCRHLCRHNAAMPPLPPCRQQCRHYAAKPPAMPPLCRRVPPDRVWRHCEPCPAAGSSPTPGTVTVTLNHHSMCSHPPAALHWGSMVANPGSMTKRPTPPCAPSPGSRCRVKRVRLPLTLTQRTRQTVSSLCREEAAARTRKRSLAKWQSTSTHSFAQTAWSSAASTFSFAFSHWDRSQCRDLGTLAPLLFYT